jgi:nucleoid-associated protein YgaU
MNVLTEYGTLKYSYFSRYSDSVTYYHKIDKKYFNGTWRNLKFDEDTTVSYTTKNGDTLDSLALKFYGSPTFWWIIADVNNILDDVVELESNIDLKIPQIASVEF